jgi:hypothetical protein
MSFSSSSLVNCTWNITVRTLKQWTSSIPGNPGLLGFYPPFLTAIHKASAKLAILAHAHIGHTPGVGDKTDWNPQRYGLATQIRNAVEAFDAVKLTFGPSTKVILLGHSIGSWFALQVVSQIICLCIVLMTIFRC